VRKNHRPRRTRLPSDDERAPRELTAQPCERCRVDDDERLVPLSNVGGAAPTAWGSDGSGELSSSGEELSSLAEAEPPFEAPEVGAVHIRRGEGPKGVV